MAVRTGLVLLYIMAGGATAGWRSHVPSRSHAAVAPPDRSAFSAGWFHRLMYPTRISETADESPLPPAHGHRHLLAAPPPAPTIDNIGTVGATVYLYVDVRMPESDGGSAIDAFEVTGMPVGGPAPGKPKLQKTGAGEVTPGRNNRRFTFNSAEYGKAVQYDFSVRAHNKAGFGPASTPPVRFATPTERVPGMPTLSITRLPDGVYLDVTPLANAIGLTYELVGHPDGWETAQRKRIVIRGATHWGDPVSGQSGTATDTLQGRRGGLAPTNTRRFKLTGYLDNVVYRFAAAARTAAGLGPESVPRIAFYECGDGYTDTGSGCVRKCPSITNCKVYSNVDCSCTECNAGNYKCNGQCIPDATCCTVAGAVCPSANSNCKCTAGNSRCPRNGGTCQCKSGYDNCNPNNPDCETNLNTSNQHCGRCGFACGSGGRTCQSGSCQCLNGFSYCASTATCRAFLPSHTLPLGSKCCTDPSWPDECQPVHDGYTACRPKSAVCSKAIGLPMATGYNWDGRLGDGTTTGRDSPVNVANVGSVSKATLLAAGLAHTCVAVNFGAEAAMCWGANFYRQLGDNTNTERHVPTVVTGPHTKLAVVAAGGYHTCGVLAGSSKVACWGAGGSYCLGTGDATGRAQPSLISDGGGSTYSSVVCGYLHTCALRTDGQVLCWGDNGQGQCGAPISAFQWIKTPTLVAGGHTFKHITAGEAHTCGIRKSNNRVMCWGDGRFLGDGIQRPDGAKMATPVEVAGNLEFTHIDAGYYHTCGVLINGSAACWGINTAGQLGDGTMMSSLAPVVVRGGLTFVDIAPGSSFSCGLLKNGSVACWGTNTDGQLGDGTETGSLVPVLVAGGKAFSAVAAGWCHTLFLP